MVTVDGLPEPTDAELRLMCAAGATRGAAFCSLLGSAEQQDWLDAALHLVWRAAAGEDVADECADTLDTLVDEDPVWQSEDPTSLPAFYADQAVGLVGEALAMSVRPTGERLDTVLTTVRSLLSMVDFKLSGEKPVIVRAGAPKPPSGPLVEKETEAEQHLVAILAETRSTGDPTSGMPEAVEARKSALMFASDVTPYLEEFAQANNWR
ncbi:hypothetical protein AB4225_33765 [Streptomyces sp. 2RAF24]|uniref:hypothetical protein n=1 Tax=unclassified Streptomyces TaxID=2593676 RepID=UPI0033C04B65